MSIEINASKGIRQNTTEVTKIPVGTTAQRPDSPQAGMIRFNTDEGEIEGFDGQEWGSVGGAEFIEATGGTVTEITDGGVDYRVHTFTSSGTFEVTQAATFTEDAQVEYLVVAGGGGGGSVDIAASSGGGGGGRVRLGTSTVGQQLYTINVGVGGSSPAGASGDNGGSSSFGFITSGGGFGGPVATSIGPGASGGDSGDNLFSGGAPFPTSTGANRASGGGGGSGGDGGDASSKTGGNGGAGVSSNITGSLLGYGGGGGGNTFDGTGGSAIDGGGSGASTSAGVPESGIPNRGGGGGGGQDKGPEGAGGSGIVIVRYRIG